MTMAHPKPFPAAFVDEEGYCPWQHPVSEVPGGAAYGYVFSWEGVAV